VPGRVSRGEVKLEPSAHTEHCAGVEHCAVAVGEVMGTWVRVVVDRGAVGLGDQRSVRVPDEPDPGSLPGQVVGGVV